MPASFDTLIRGGRVIDGTGNPWQRADIGIAGGKVSAVGALTGATARRTIDAANRWIVPGFVDVHTHSDFSLILNPTAESHLGQGITTDVIGNCGFSAFPRTPNNRRLMLDPEGVDGSWSSTPEYFAALRAARPGCNVVALVGHSTIRQAVLGKAERPATAAELQQMRELVREAMSSGAVGLSTGLDYVPGKFAELTEFVELSKVVAEFGGLYVSHVRGLTDTILPAVDEAIAIGERSGVPVQISHMTVFGRANWGLSEDVIQRIDAARARGVDVTADVFAYPTAGSSWGPRAVFPEDVSLYLRPSDEALRSMRTQLQDPKRRAEIRRSVDERRTMAKKGFYQEMRIFGSWSEIFVEGVGAGSANAALVGRSVASIAADRKVDPAELYFDLIVEEGEAFSSVHIQISENDHKAFIEQPWMMFSTDTVTTSPERAGDPFNVFQAHPGNYATYPRVLKRLALERGWLRLEDAVRKCTSFPAQRFGLRDRGFVGVGAAADLVVLDLDGLTEGASWLHPHRYPTGIDHVLVNGVSALSRGRLTGERAGQALASPAA
ncbi:MAG: N-acyl-D-amino-acid deacylase [Chloroflexota bacterium]|nr:N-acyl-D-amino-acid deacylase [Chloroflexota bacterium]